MSGGWRGQAGSRASRIGLDSRPAHADYEPGSCPPNRGEPLCLRHHPPAPTSAAKPRARRSGSSATSSRSRPPGPTPAAASRSPSSSTRPVSPRPCTRQWRLPDPTPVDPAALARAAARHGHELLGPPHSTNPRTKRVRKLRKHVRLLIQLADDWADTEVDDERTYTLPWGGMHIRAQDVSALCETCSAKLTEPESAGSRG